VPLNSQKISVTIVASAPSAQVEPPSVPAGKETRSRRVP
jgi:hypothetical protein